MSGPTTSTPGSSQAGATAARSRTLLIVDDEPDMLDSLRHLFRREYRVVTAGSGDEALDLLGREEVHVILSDQRMPGMTGDQLLTRARAARPDATRMIVTGYADLDSVVRAVNEGQIYRYIIKPWDPSELQGIVRQAVEHHDLIAERRRLIDDLKATNAELTDANARLAESSALKSAFIEVASHEFNTPITLVLGLSELLLLLDPAREPEERQIIDQMSTAARQLARLVADTITLMRSDDFRPAARLVESDLAPVLVEAADRIAPFVSARRMTFDLDLGPDLGAFPIDRPKLGDAVLNLLTNALKFTPDGGRIGLSARRSGDDAAEIVVSDRGIGIEPRAVRRLFEPFFTEFDASRHSSGDFGFEKRGLGLGLTIVRQFVELHGGDVRAESAPGSGTRVTIRLPRRPFPKPDGPIE